MFKSYLITALRNIKKQKGYSVINIFGLALGMAGCLLIYLWVQDELSYDRYHQNAHRIYRIERNVKHEDSNKRWPITSGPYGPALAADYPEIENFARVDDVNLTIQDTKNITREETAIVTDGNLFSIFDFVFEKGDPHAALNEPFTVVLTREKALQYIGTDQAMGETIQIRWNGVLQDFKVTGIIKEIPPNSHFRFDIALSMLNYSEVQRTRWVGNFLYTYVLLSPTADPKALESLLPAFIEKHVAGPHQALLSEGVRYSDLVDLVLMPLTDIHLHPTPEWEIGSPGNAASVYIFSAIALLILLIACMNFMNLSTARGSKRAKEVGLRKTVGAHRHLLWSQFLGETILMAFIAFSLSLGLIALVLPYFNQLSGKFITFGSIFEGWNLLILFTGIAATGALAGLYPAFFLSAFEPAQVLQGQINKGKKKTVFRQAMVTGQFVISIALIIGTIVVTRQMIFIQNKTLGFDKENVVVINPTRFIAPQKIESFRNELLADPRIRSVTSAERIPGDLIYSDTSFKKRGADQLHNMIWWCVNYEYIETLNIPIKFGRAFSRSFLTDSSAVLINETAATELGLDPQNAVGQLLGYVSADGSYENYSIIGVMEDFHFKPLHQKIEPVALFLNPSFIFYILVRIDPGEPGVTLAHIKSHWNTHFPEQELNYQFLDQTLQNRYGKEMQTRSLFFAFSALSIIVACMGLLGLASYAAEERTKEIGIRKVLGANIGQIILLMIKEFTILVLWANLIAWPLAWFFMRRWLENFAFRIDMGIDIFLLAASGVLVIALFTVGQQAIRVSLINPSKSLKYE